MGPRLISEHLAEANEKKIHSSKRPEKKKKKKRPREWSRLLLIGLRLFIPLMYGLINLIEFAIICGGPLAGQRLTRPQIVFSILGPPSQCLANNLFGNAE